MKEKKTKTRMLKLVEGKLTFGYTFSHVFMAIMTHCGILGLFLVLSLLDLFLNTQFFVLFLCLFALMLSIAVEETFHIIAAVVILKSASLHGVVIRALWLKNFPLLCCNAAVRFSKEEITNEDHALIAFGGAFCSLLVSAALAAILLVLWQSQMLPVAFALLATPIISLIPSRYKEYTSDGYVVVHYLHHKEQYRMLLPLAGKMLMYVLRPCAIQSRS